MVEGSERVRSFTARVLELVAEEMGVDGLGQVRLSLEYRDGSLRRWGPGEPRNGADSLARFDAGLKARLSDLLGAAA